jgi:hypothetical protein
MAQSSFTLSGVPFPQGDDPLGLWVVPQEPVSYGLEAHAPTEPPQPTWRIQLPAEPAEAQALLDRQIGATERAQRDLARASRELERLDPRTAAPSFGASDELFAHKEALLEAVNAFHAPEEVAYGLPGLPETIRDQELYRQWHAFLDQIRQVLAHYARVETALAGADVGWTTVSWTGDFDTAWQPHVTMFAMQTHLQSVHLALSSRLALLRLVAAITSGAVGLAIKTTGSGGVLLLPAVWKFMRDVLEELRQSWPQIHH